MELIFNYLQYNTLAIVDDTVDTVIFVNFTFYKM